MPVICSICRGPIGIRRSEVTPRTGLSLKDVDWCNYIRVIFKSRERSSQHQISGISYVFLDRYSSNIYRTFVPADPKAASLPPPFGISLGQRHTFDCNCLPTRRCMGYRGLGHCYRLHTRCWELTDKVIGPITEENINFFVAALERTWREFHSDADKLIRLEEPEWIGSTLEKPKEIRSDRKRLSVTCDPFKIPGIQNLVRRSRRSREVEPWATLLAKNIPPQSDHGFFKLPLELRLNVLDFLPGILDLGNATAAFQLSLPDSFWRSRFLSLEIREIENVSADELDWESFFVGFKKLLDKRPWGLENRLHILRILHYTRDRFIELQRHGIDSNMVGPGFGNGPEA